MREETVKKILDKKIIAIVRGMEEKKIIPLAEAMFAGGIELMEITFNPARPETFAETLRGIAAIGEHFGGKVSPGAGTVISEELVKMAAGAGALYIVSPNVDTAVIRQTREQGLVSLPGAMTPSECQTAHGAGADFIKLFPAGNLGVEYLKAIRAPLSHLRFMAVGGINEKNAADFIRAGAAGLGIGGNLVNREWIAAGSFDKIRNLAAVLTRAVKEE